MDQIQRNKQFGKALNDIKGDQSSLYDHEQTQLQQYLTQIPDTVIDTKIRQTQREQLKQKQAEDEEQQKESVFAISETLDQVQKKISLIKQQNPQQVYVNVKNQLAQVNQVPMRLLNINGTFVERKMFTQALKNMLINYPYPQKGLQLFHRYNILRTTSKGPLTNTQLELNAKVFKDKLDAYKQGRSSVQNWLDRINRQIEYIYQHPKRWFKWHLKKRLGEGILLNRSLNNQSLMEKQIQQRLQVLTNRKTRIENQIQLYTQRASKKRVKNIREYNKILQAKNQLHTTQKGVLTYLIDTKNNQIGSMKQYIKTESEKFQMFKTEKQNKIKQIKSQSQTKQKALLNDIQKIKKVAEEEKIKLANKDEEQRKLRQKVLQTEREKQAKVKQMIIAVNKQQDLIKRMHFEGSYLKKKDQQQAQIIAKQGSQLAIQQKQIVQQQQSITQQQSSIIALQQQNAKLRQQNTAQQATIRQQNAQNKKLNQELMNASNIINQSKQVIQKQQSIIDNQQTQGQQLLAEKQSLEQMLNNQISSKRQLEDEIRTKVMNSNIQNKNKQIALLKQQSDQKVTKLNKQLKEKQQKLVKEREEKTKQIQKLQKQVVEHKKQLQLIEKKYVEDMQHMKKVMDNQIGYRSQIIIERQAAISNISQEYVRLQQLLQGRQAAFQQWSKKTAQQLKTKQQSIQKLLAQARLKDSQNKTLIQGYQKTLHSLKNQHSQRLLTAKNVFQKNLKDHMDALRNQKLKSDRLEKKIIEQHTLNDKYEQQLQNKLAQIELLKKQKENALKGKQLAEQKASELQFTLNMTKQQLDKILKASQVFDTSFKYWFNPKQNLYTIRQCFKMRTQQKWIASTRGINFTQQDKPFIQYSLSRWAALKNPEKAEPSSGRIGKSMLLDIIDIYKGKKYFSMRQAYYYSNKLEPTRRGFNISAHDLPSFFKGIMTLTNHKDILD